MPRHCLGFASLELFHTHSAPALSGRLLEQQCLCLAAPIYQSLLKSARVTCGEKYNIIWACGWTEIHRPSCREEERPFFGYEWPLYELPHDMVPQEVQYVRKCNLSPASSCFFPSCHFLPLGVRWRGQLSWTRSGKCWPAQAPLPPSAPSLLSRHRPAHPGSERGWREW